MPAPFLANPHDPTGHQTLRIISHARAFNRWMYQAIRPQLQGRILEIGSGIGNISDFVVKDGYPVSLSDYDEAYVAILSEKYKRSPNVQAVFRIDLEDPHFLSAHALAQQYDTIFLLNVIEHIRDHQAAIRNCAHMLKPQGRLIVLAPAYPTLFSRLDKELGHHRRYTRKSMTHLLRGEGLSIVQQQYFNLLGLAGWFFWGKVAGRKQLTAPGFNLFNVLVPLARLLDKLAGKRAGLSVIVTGAKK